MLANSIGILCCGSLMLLIGTLMKIFPPRKISYIYGYRTTLSMKNQQTWDYANRLSTNIIFFGGIINFIACIPLAIYLPTNAGVLINLGILLAIPLIMIIVTETRLSKKFGHLK